MRRWVLGAAIGAAFLFGSIAAAGLGLAAPELWSRIAPPEEDGGPDCSNCGPNGRNCSCLCSNGE